MNEIWHWNARELFGIVSEDKTNGNNYPFDKIFSKIIDIEKRGLGYFYITYKKEVIYIGITKGNEDVIESRIKKQLESITLRSSRVSLSPRALEVFQTLENFGGFNRTLENIGCEASRKKVLFANKNWNDFSQLSDVNITDFDICWYAMPNSSIAEVKLIADIAKYLLKPRCNG